MSRQPWSTSQYDYPCLRVPTLEHAPLREEEDIIYALWMVSQYMGNEFPDEEVRLKTKVPTIDEISGIIDVNDKLSWGPNQTDLTNLSILITQSFQFSLDAWDTPPSKGLVGLAEENLAVDLPMIGYIDDLQLRRNIRGEGAIHPVVIVGTDDEYTAIADPWTGNVREEERDKLEDAWDPMRHQIIEVDLAKSSGTTPEEAR